MCTQSRRLAIATALIWIGVGACERVEAGGIALSTPAGLTPGESFRFVFVTDGFTTATSSNIADYNSFVTAQAGGATYYGSMVSWDAIGSTSTVNAIDNIGQQAITGVFLANGTEVTTSTTHMGLWSGALLAPIDHDLTSNQIHTITWTGTIPSGTAEPTSPLGAAQVEIGDSAFKNQSWIDLGGAEDPTEGDQMYGISQVLVVPPSAVPEPSSLLLASTALMAGMAFGWSRSGRAQRRQTPVGTETGTRLVSTKLAA